MRKEREIQYLYHMEFQSSGSRRAKLATTTSNKLTVSGTSDSTMCELLNVAVPTADSSAANKHYVDQRIQDDMQPPNVGYTFGAQAGEGDTALTTSTAVVHNGWVGGTIFIGNARLGVVASIASTTSFTLASPGVPSDGLVDSGTAFQIGALSFFTSSYSAGHTGAMAVYGTSFVTLDLVSTYVYTPDGTYMGKVASVNTGTPSITLDSALENAVAAYSGVYHFHGITRITTDRTTSRGSYPSIAIGTGLVNEEYRLGSSAVTAGYSNVAIGGFTANNLTLGYENTAVGTRSLNTLSIGAMNTAIGAKALSYKSNNLSMTLSQAVSATTSHVSATSGDGHTTATNGWQKIIKGASYALLDITSIAVMLSNTGSAVNVVLHIYDGEYDSSASDPTVRFSGMTATHTTPAVSVTTDTSTKVAFTFDLTGKTLTSNTLSFWIKEASDGSLAGVQVQITSSGTEGGSGNNFGTLNHEVFGEAGSQTVTVNSSSNVLAGMALFYDGTQVATTDSVAPKPSDESITAFFTTGLSSGSALLVSDNPSVAVGTEALNGETFGGLNVAVGTKAFQQATTARWGVAMGYQAASALTTGDYSTCLGYNCASSLTTGSNNVVVGASANVSASAAANQIVIGQGATGQGNNYAVIGNADVTRLYASQDGGADVYANSIINSSDRRLKDEIEMLPLGLAWVQQLQPVQFRWKDGRQGGKRSLGLVAQDVVAALASSGLDPADYAAVTQDDNEERTYRLDYTQLLMPLITAVQELSSRVQELENHR